MKRIILTFLILTTTILLVACQNGNGENNNGDDKYNLEPAPGCLVPYLDGGWVCTWADEFKLDQVDPFKWNFEINDSGGGNNELQYYIKDNATVKDGILTITGKHETFRTRQYTSSRITTHRKGDFRYGRIQIRAKNPVGRGTWPAIWMMPTRSIYGGWPRSGEIDIMEYVGYDPSKIHTTIHTAKFNHKSRNTNRKINDDEFN
ncbi:MAG: glycoside hydrolase family 16 protein [Acholeplasmataceae bacterium]